MLLIVDANIIFSSLIKKGSTLRLIEFNSIFKLVELITPEFIWEEINEHKEEIVKKSGLSKEELEKVLESIRSEIKTIPKETFLEFLENAKEISPKNDFPYVALALKLKSLGFDVKIWSNDKKLKESLRDLVEVVSTSDLLSILKINR